MEDQWKIAEYNSEWKTSFLTLAMKLRIVLGEAADRIDHVGSTSIEGMDAKPIVDIQISVTDFDNESLYREQIESLGFNMRRKNPDKTKKYFREIPGSIRTHIHVRRTGSVSEQITLLFRDYLRTHPFDCLKYADEKHRLMKLYSKERSKYVEGKGTIVWEIMQKAHAWSMDVGWIPGESDV